MGILLVVIVLGVVGLLATPLTSRVNGGKTDNWIDRSGGHRF